MLDCLLVTTGADITAGFVMRFAIPGMGGGGGGGSGIGLFVVLTAFVSTNGRKDSQADNIFPSMLLSGVFSVGVAMGIGFCAAFFTISTHSIRFLREFDLTSLSQS